MNRQRLGTVRRSLVAALLVVFACVGIAGCTVPRGTTITSEDRQRAKAAVAASALFDERERVCLSTRPGWDEAKCKATEGQIASASEALKGVPDVCKTYLVTEDTCAEAIVSERVADGRVSQYDTVISPWRTAALIGGIALALIVLGGGALALRRRSPQPHSAAARSTKPQPPTRLPARRPTPPAPFTAAPSAPVPAPQQTPPPMTVTGEVVGYAAPPVAPARPPREPVRISPTVKCGAAIALAAVVVVLLLAYLTRLGLIRSGMAVVVLLALSAAARALLPNGAFTPKRAIVSVATFVGTVLATFIAVSAVVSIGTWIAGPPQPEWLHWLEWKGLVHIWLVALVLAAVTTTLTVRALVKRERSRR